MTAVSAASYNGELSAESIVAAFGENLASSTLTATSVPLPTTLGGVTVKVTDSAGVERNAPLFFVSLSQINYQAPPGASGISQIRVLNADQAVVATGAVPIVTASPDCSRRTQTVRAFQPPLCCACAATRNSTSPSRATMRNATVRPSRLIWARKAIRFFGFFSVPAFARRRHRVRG